MLHVNLHCVLALSRAAGRGFVEQGSGAIVNVASLLSFQGGVLVSSYATAKHGVLGLTRALANEWAPYGVRVNALAPGYIATDFTERLRADACATRRSRPHPRRPLGLARGSRGRVRLPLLARQPLRHGHGADRRRRLDEPLMTGCGSARQCRGRRLTCAAGRRG